MPFYGSAIIARRNASLSKTAEHCAAAKAKQASGGSQYRLRDIDKQVRKFCEDKHDDVNKRCQEAREALQMGKSTYRMRNTEGQVARWCLEAGSLDAAIAGKFTPASPQEIAEELYWDESQMTSGSGGAVEEEGGGSGLLLPALVAGGALLLLGGVFFASR